MTTLIHGDCREILPTLDEASINSVITDPPYGVTSLEWDIPVDDWLPLVDRVLKPEGSIWIFGSLRSLAPMIAAADNGELGPWKFSHEVIWEKHNGSGFQADRFRRCSRIRRALLPPADGARSITPL